MTEEMTKSLPVSKWMVYNSYLKVIASDESAGIDNQSIEHFHENLRGNLNKIWDRMTSGVYFPTPSQMESAARKKLSGISTISDRIAQGVIKDWLEPALENTFHPNSFGCGPSRSVYNARKQYHDNCGKYRWFIEIHIKEFIDNINHDILLKLLQKHTKEKWIMLYAERWLNAGAKQEDESIMSTAKGVAQTGILSPLFASLYLHYCFDKWMDEENMQNPFERYADDIVIHCNSAEEARHLLEKLQARMQQYGLEVNSEKTKIVYCKNSHYNDRYYNNKFSTANHTFQSVATKDKREKKNSLRAFCAGIGQQVTKGVGLKLRAVLIAPWAGQKRRRALWGNSMRKTAAIQESCREF